MSDPSEDAASLAPDEAFKTLGNETRVQILQALGTADRPLRFSELFEAVEYDKASNFSYHLEQLTDHFVHKTEEGYELRRAGERVIEAVLSGAITEAPRIERTRLDEECQLCRAPIEIEYAEEEVTAYCTECDGIWGDGDLGRRHLPPSGLRDRSPKQVYRAAWIRTNLLVFTISNRLCPRCWSVLEFDTDVCDAHDDSAALCPACGERASAKLKADCGICPFDIRGSLPIAFAAHPVLLSFLLDRELDPFQADTIADVQQFWSNYDEDIRSVDPFEASFTFRLGEGTITISVDDRLEVVAVERD